MNNLELVCTVLEDLPSQVLFWNQVHPQKLKLKVYL